MALMDAYGLSLMSVQAWGLMLSLLSIGFILGSSFIAKFGLGQNPLKRMLIVNVIEMFWMVRKALLAGTLAIPPDSKLRSQLTGIEYDVESDRAIRVHKQGKKKQSASPDLADALALAVEARNRGRRF